MNQVYKTLALFLIAVAAVFLLGRAPKLALAPGDFQPAPIPIVQPASTTLFFAGDIVLAREVEARINRAHNLNLPFEKVREQIAAADIAFANLESPFSDKPTLKADELTFRADPKNIAGLNFAGFDVLSTANNHSFDQGEYGVRYTYDWLAAHGIIPAGSGVPAYDPTQAVIEKNHILFGFLAYTYAPSNTIGSSPMVGNLKDLARLKQDILMLKGHYADVVIVSMHAGTEYMREPTYQQKEFAHAAIDAGADLVIGAHSHWVQPVEQYHGKWIFYSLGNFVFDQMWSQDTKEGLTVKITMENQLVKKIELLPVIIEDYSTPRWANPAETESILHKIDLTSPILMDKN